MKYKSSSSVSIVLYGDRVHPEQITTRIGIMPTSFGKEKNTINYFWEYKIINTTALDELEESLEYMKDIFMPHSEFLSQIEGSIKIYISIYGSGAENNGAYLNLEFIYFIYRIKSSLEFNVYQ